MQPLPGPSSSTHPPQIPPSDFVVGSPMSAIDEDYTPSQEASYSEDEDLPSRRGKRKAHSSAQGQPSSKRPARSDENNPLSVKLPAFAIQKLRVHESRFEEQRLRLGQTHHEALTAFVEAVVSAYNRDQKKKGFPLTFTLACDDRGGWWDSIANEKFRVRVFTGRAVHPSSCADFLDKVDAPGNFHAASVYYLFFYYRTIKKSVQAAQTAFERIHEVFALSTGDAWHAVRPRADFTWPVTIAKKLFDSKKITGARKRQLCGHELASKTLYRKGWDPLLITNINTLITEFSTAYRKETIHDLTSFRTQGGKISRNEIKADVGVAVLHLPKRLSAGEIAEVLSYLSMVARNPKYRERPGFDFLERITRVRYRLAPFLDEKMKQLVWRAFRSRASSTISFTHRWSFSFASSRGVSLVYKPKKNGRCAKRKRWSSPPDAEALFRALRKFPDFEEMREEGHSDKFFAAIQKLHIQFSTRHREPFLKFFEGEIRMHPQGRVFFKVQGVWRKVSAQYLCLVQTDFNKLLKRAVLKSDHPAHLPLPWMRHKKWASFTEEDLKPFFSGEQEVASYLEGLLGKRYSFIDPDGNPVEARLYGRILNNADIQTHQNTINQLLMSETQLTPTTIKRKLRVNARRATLIRNALSKRRCYCKKVAGGRYLMVDAPPHDEPPSALDSYLESRVALRKGVQAEADYNRSYLFTTHNQGKPYGRERGYLVGDQILTKSKIELFDVAYYDTDNLYLYVVKGGFGQSTCYASKQMSQAASLLKAALQQSTKDNVLEVFWNRCRQGGSPYREGVKQQAEALGQAAFFDLFKGKRITFVYAFLDDAVDERLLDRERHLQTSLTFTPQDFNGYDSILSEEGRLCPSQVLAGLKKSKFLTKDGKVTDKLLTAARTSFKLGKRFSVEQERAIFDRLKNHLQHFQSQFQSTLAKVELVQLADEIQNGLDFGFKICQIRRPPNAAGYGQNVSLKPPGLPVDPPVEFEGLSLDYEENEDLLESILSTRLIQVGSCSYLIEETVGDGACALHALLGEKIDGQYRYRGGGSAVRRRFVAKLKQAVATEPIATLLKTNLKNMFLEAHKPKPNRNAAMLFHEWGLGEVFCSYLKEEERLEADVALQQPLLLEQEASHWLLFFAENPDTQEHLKNFITDQDVEDPVQFLREHKLLLMQKLDGDRNKFTELLSVAAMFCSESGIPQLHEQIAGTYKRRQALVCRVEARKQRFLAENWKTILQRYWDCLLHQDYYYFNDELEMAAHLFGRQMILVTRHGVTRPFNPRGEGRYVICHEGAHYSRCTLHDDPEPDPDEVLIAALSAQTPSRPTRRRRRLRRYSERGGRKSALT